MSIQLICACGTALTFEDAQLGLTGPCYQCGQTVTVAHPPPAAAQSAAILAEVAAATHAASALAPAPDYSGIPEIQPGPAQQKVLKKLTKEASKTGHTIDGVRVLQLRDPIGFKEAMKHKLMGQMHTDRVMGVLARGPSGPILVTIPFSGSLVLAHELASRIPGTLEKNLYLTRGLMGSWSSGRFSVTHQNDEHPLADAADQNGGLGDLVEWNWENGKTIIKLDWGLQAVPDRGGTLHVMQTAPQGIMFKNYGLAWYEERRAAFADFLSTVGGTPEDPPQWDFEPRSVHFFDGLG